MVQSRTQLFLEVRINHLRNMPSDLSAFYSYAPLIHAHQHHKLADLPFSVLALAPHRRCRNIYLLPIDFTFRLRLRDRLTLLRLSWNRNPWAFGEKDFHLLYRYSCQHSHFQTVQHTLPIYLQSLWNAPLPLIIFVGFSLQSFKYTCSKSHIYILGCLY